MDAKEIDELLVQARNGDDSAWESLIAGMEPFIGARIKAILKDSSVKIDEYYREDLMQAGMLAVVQAAKNYEPGSDASFVTYANYYIDPEIIRELSGIKGIIRTKDPSEKVRSSGDDMSPDEIRAYKALSILRYGAHIKHNELTAEERKAYLDLIQITTDDERCTKESRVLQIMEILRAATDEKHPITIEELKDCLTMYRVIKYDSGFLETSKTIAETIEHILAELTPLEYKGTNDADYKIKYSGYQNDELKKKIEGAPGKHEITDLRYIQPFSYHELNEMIQTISFSNMLTTSDKDNLVGKLLRTVGGCYSSPFWDGKHLRVASGSGVEGRFNDGDSYIGSNLRTIQTAINNLWQIKFTMNGYDKDGALVPTARNPHYFSPFHLVVYQDLFYLIGLWSDGANKKIYHYRVDLMTDVEILKDNRGKPVRIKMYGIEDLPIWDYNWNPKKYLSEHIYMAYDEPRDIKLKIKNTDYTDIYKWFNGYTKTNLPCEDGYDIIIVRTSPTMIVHWALQYGSKVEILDEDIRAEIRKELEKLGEKYGVD